MKMKCAAALLLLGLILGLCGCGDSNTVPATSAIQLTREELPIYTIIYPYQAGTDLSRMAQQVKDKLYEDFDADFSLEIDRLAPDGLADNTVAELLIGKTDRPETRKVAEGLEHDGYAVTVEGGKIVIFGNTYNAQQKAVDAFLTALSRNEAGEIVLNLPAGGIVEPGEAPLFEEAKPTDYVIVYDEENKAPARALQAAIRRRYGYELFLRSAAEPETPWEILVGACGRKEGETALGEITSPVGYKLKVDGKKVVLVGRSGFAAKQAVEYFRQNYVEHDFALLWQLPAALEYNSAAIAGAEYAQLTAGADIRIMSFNLLTELWNQKLPVEGRDEIAAATLLTYLPDVIGLQEVSDKWYEQLVPMVEQQYTFINRNTPQGKTNYSGMAYNSAKVKLIDSGCELFSMGNSRNMRLMNWAVFETISGGKRFVVVNTHFDPHNTTEAISNRHVQAEEMGKKVKALQETYGCPVITTGDYNCPRNSAEYKLFLETAGVVDAQWNSVKAVNNYYKTHHGVGAEAPSGESAIDHITYTDGVESLFYINHNSSPTINVSDHNPIMADLKLN